jgi:hypothetical protein
MKRIISVLTVLMLLQTAHGAEAEPGSLVKITDCWIRSMPGSIPSGAYFTVKNMSDHPVDLISVRSSAFGMAMLHQTRTMGSTSKMVMVDKATVPAQGTLSFAPGGYHVMLEEPKAHLEIGSSTSLTFEFGEAQEISSPCLIKPAGSVSK